MTSPTQQTKSEHVYSLIKERGPILPVDIVKEIGGNTILTGALISDLVRRGKVSVTKNIRVGSSPLYYVPGQEERLEKYLHLLSESERRAVEILKKNGVVFEHEVPQLYRIGLMNATDFSIPLNIKYKEKEYHAFKWSLLDSETAKQLIQNKLEEKAGKASDSPVFETESIEEPSSVTHPQETHTSEDTGPEQQEMVQKNVYSDTTEEAVQQSQSSVPEGEQLSISLNALEEDMKDDELLRSFYGLSQEKGFKFQSYEIIRKNREINANIRFYSPFGQLHFFAKALDKKRISPQDMYALYAEAQIRKLPALFITGGELTSQAQKLVDKELTTIKVYMTEELNKSKQ